MLRQRPKISLGFSTSKRLSVAATQQAQGIVSSVSNSFGLGPVCFIHFHGPYSQDKHRKSTGPSKVLGVQSIIMA